MLKKIGLIIVTSLLSIGLNAADIRSYPLGHWPILAEFVQSECLDINSDLLNLPITARAEKTSIISRFFLSSFGGNIYVNPQINKGWQSLTFSIDTASNRVGESGMKCLQMFDIGLKAWPEKYNKLYIVVDKTVRYEITIDKTHLDIDNLN